MIHATTYHDVPVERRRCLCCKGCESAARGMVLSMLGIDDPWILSVYLLCIFSTLLCVIYGVVNWNRGGEQESLEIKEEADWEAGEEAMQEKELGL